jgi:hypothetical protein
VLYNGEPVWTAAQEANELIDSLPAGLEQYRPSIRYLLIQERGYSETELVAMRNLVAALFRLENSRSPEDVSRVLETLIEWLQAPEQSDLRRAFAGWMRQVLLPRRMPGAVVPELTDLQEVRTMLAERVKEWTQQWRDEGWEEGRKEGGARVLVHQLERKFGPLDATVTARIAQADAEQFLVWAERVLTADRLEDVFL